MRLNAGFRSDIIWWSLFLERWNGVSIIWSLHKMPVDSYISSDASGSWGCGAFYHDQWFNLAWDSCPAIKEMHIAVKELLPVVIACAVWVESFRKKHIRCRCDNAAVVAMVNKGSSTHPLAMHLLRCLSYICAKHSFVLSAEHLAGSKNTAADALSRNNPSLFRSQVKEASPNPARIPRDLPSVLVDRTPNWISAE